MIPSAILGDCARWGHRWVRLWWILCFCLASAVGYSAPTQELGLVLIAPTAAGTPNIALNARHPLWVKWPPVNDRSGTEHMLLVRLGRLLDVSEGLFNVREDRWALDRGYPYRPLLPERLDQVLGAGKSDHPARPRTPFRMRTTIVGEGPNKTLNRLLLPLTLGERPSLPNSLNVWVTEAKDWDAVAREAARLDRVLIVEYPPLQNRDHSRLWLWKGFAFGNAAKVDDVPALDSSIPGLLPPETLLTLLIEPERISTSPMIAGPDDDPSMWVQFLAERGKALTTGMLVIWAIATLVGFVLIAREVAGGIAVGMLLWASALPALVFLATQAHRVVEVTGLPMVFGILTVILVGAVALLMQRLRLLNRPTEDGILAAIFWIGWGGTVAMLLADPVYSLFSPSARPWAVPWPTEFSAGLVGYSCLIPLSRPVWTPLRLVSAAALGGCVLGKLYFLYGSSPMHLSLLGACTILSWLCAAGIRVSAAYLVLVFNPFIVKQAFGGYWAISKFGAHSAMTPESATDFFGVVPGLGAWSVLLVGCVIAGLALFSNAYSGYRLRRSAFGRANLRWVQVTFAALVGLIFSEPSWIGLGGTFLMITVPPVLALGAHEPEIF